MKKALFIDRDGTIIVEPPVTEQVNSIEELEFLPYAIGSLAFIARAFDYELVMVTNQDGLGSAAYPYSTFQPIQDLVLRTLAGEGVHFADVLIDCTRPEDNAPTRKPRTGMLGKYMNGDYDLSASYVIGDRDTDVELAHNLGSKYIKIDQDTDWKRIVALLRGERVSTINRKTKETDIKIALDLDGNGKCNISTGLGFFDHLLEQIGRHGGIDLTVEVKGDLNVDEHHTIEDTAIALGECLRQALGDKRGIERYGFTLPMDDCLCSCVLDFGGRAWLVWKAEFHREKVGDVPTEMFHHFFHSLASAASMNLYIEAAGDNEHHKIEGIFKSLGKAIRQAIRRDVYSYELPSSKGVL